MRAETRRAAESVIDTFPQVWAAHILVWEYIKEAQGCPRYHNLVVVVTVVAAGERRAKGAIFVPFHVGALAQRGKASPVSFPRAVEIAIKRRAPNTVARWTLLVCGLHRRNALHLDRSVIRKWNASLGSFGRSKNHRYRPHCEGK